MSHDAGRWQSGRAFLRPASALLASLMLHAGVYATLRVPDAEPPPVPQERAISVELLPFGLSGTRNGAPAELAPAEPSEPMPGTGPTIRATTLMSDSVLADPRSRQAREALPTLDPADRMDQLCAIEAMSQIHEWRKDLHPDRLVSFALSDPRVAGNAIIADGAAFRSMRHWFALKFRCELTQDGTKVAAFEFQVGKPVPREDWQAFNLPEAQ